MVLCMLDFTSKGWEAEDTSGTSGKLEIKQDKEQQVLAKVSGKGEGSSDIQKTRI